MENRKTLSELVITSVKIYGGDNALAERLLRQGESYYLTWVVRALVDKYDVYNSLHELADMLGMKLAKIRYAYYTAPSVPVKELKQRPEYNDVMTILHEIQNTPKLWYTLQKCTYRQLKRICIEELVLRDETSLAIMERLKSSNGLVYEVRSKTIKRDLEERGKRGN